MFAISCDQKHLIKAHSDIVHFSAHSSWKYIQQQFSSIEKHYGIAHNKLQIQRSTEISKQTEQRLLFYSVFSETHRCLNS